MRKKELAFAFIPFVLLCFLIIALLTGCDVIANTLASAVETTTAVETTAGEVIRQETTTTIAANLPKTGGILRIHINEPVSLDPQKIIESEGTQIARQVWDGLFTYDPVTLETKSKLCEKYEISGNGLTYTFYIKKGVKFHSGKELKAQDFVYSWTRLVFKDTASRLAYLLSSVDGYEECQDGSATDLRGIKALDDYSFQVTLKYPFADFLNTLGSAAFYPVSKDSIEKAADKAGEMPDGTGPFKFVKWEHDQYIELVRNEDYYGQKSYLDGVKYVIIPDEQTAFLEFQAGNFEYVTIPKENINAVKADPQWKAGVIIHPVLGLYYFIMNVDAEPFKGNLPLREAIGLMIDRQNICDILSDGVYVPATGFVPPGIQGFLENAMGYTFSLESAKAKLAEAGYPEGKGLPTFKLVYSTGPENEKIAKAVQADGANIGIKIETEGFESGTMPDKAKSGEIIFYGRSWQAVYPAMDNFLYPLFYSQSSDNYSGYNNPEADRLLTEARNMADEMSREAKYREIEKLILNDSAFVPIYYYGTRKIIQPYVRGFT
ncbi:MAG: peptide ABC transporter substrate-binding protein, partial [Actinomycetota bacterium]